MRTSRPWSRKLNDDERARGEAAGLRFDYAYGADELVRSDNTIFVATGVTDGGLVAGVNRLADLLDCRTQ